MFRQMPIPQTVEKARAQILEQIQISNKPVTFAIAADYTASELTEFRAADAIIARERFITDDLTELIIVRVSDI